MSVFETEESCTDVVTQVISSVTPAAGCPASAAGILTCIGSGKNCSLLSGSKTTDEDPLFPMFTIHWLGLSQLTEYCVSPLPVFLIDREYTAVCPGLAPSSFPVPARMVKRPSTLSTTDVILMVCEIVGASLSNIFKSLTKLPGRANLGPAGFSKSASTSSKVSVTILESPTSPDAARSQGPVSLSNFHHSSIGDCKIP